MLTQHLSYEACQSGWLGVNLDHLRNFGVHPNLNTEVFSSLPSSGKRLPQPEIEPMSLIILSLRLVFECSLSGHHHP